MFKLNNYGTLREANENRNGITRERVHNLRTKRLPRVEVTEVPRATLAEREVLLDLGIIDNNGAINSDY